MAYLGNTLINGSLRCLNKAYFNDLSVSDTMTVASLSTTGNATIGGTLGVTGATTIAGTLTLTKTTDVSGTANNSPALIIGGTATGKHIEIDLDEIQAKTNGTSVGDLWINNDGGMVYIKNLNSTTSTITTGNITTLNASSTTTTNLVVNDTLKSFKWDISNVANLANDFMVAPTIEISSTGTVSISSLNTSTGACTLTFSDSTQITSDEFAGCKWYKGSKVRITVDLNGKLNSNIEGTLSAHMNPTAGSLTISTTLENFSGLSNTTGINASGATIMLYEVAESTNNETTHPVGIRMTAYGTNNSSYIDMYGGTASTDYTHPIVRIGRLNGITFNGKTFGTNALPAAWGIYTLNGYFEGAIVANEGKIANFTIASDKLYTGTHFAWNTNEDGIFIDNTYISFGKQALTYFKNDGTGKIGNWKIDSISLYNGTFGTANSAMISTGSSTAKVIGGSESISGWTFTSGANFGVTKTGALYASDVNISGAVNATALHVGSSSSTNHLIYENNAIDLETDWLRFDKDTSSVIIGKNRNPKVVIDGKNFYMRNTFDDNYFNIGDHRVDGLYSFTSRYPDVLIGEEGDDDNGNYVSLTRSYLKKYGLTILDSENKNAPISINKATSTRCYSNEIVPGKKYFAIYTTDSPMYSMQFINSNKNIGVNAVSFSVTGVASGNGAFNIGEQTRATGAYSFAEGYFCEANNIYTHAEGYFSKANGLYSHAEGSSTANGECSHSEGHSWANGVRSHGEGYVCFAHGDYSHAEGIGSDTRGEASHAEGGWASAYGDYSHAEGRSCYARGEGSHAEGYRCEANGKYSHAGGINTFASRDYQTVIGKRNKKTITVVPPTYCNTTILCEDDLLCSKNGNDYVSDSGNYAFIIGNGDPNYLNLDSNAFTVDWDGNLWCAGKVNDVDLYCISTEGTLASSNYQTAIGKYNIEDTNNTYALIIGNGEDDDNRSNALTVDWNGYISAHQYIVQYPDTTVGTHPSSDYYGSCVAMRDSTGGDFARLLSTHTVDGRAGFTIEALRTVNSSTVWNSLRLFIDDNGTRSVQVSDPAAWRNALGMGETYTNATNNNTQTYSAVVCAGFITSGQKDLFFHFPCNITSGTIKVTKLAIVIRGGAGQEYFYEASGNGTTYTQLGTEPTIVWENGKSKRTNGVTAVNAWLVARSGIKVVVSFKNQLRKSASTAVVQNNMPVGLMVTITFTVS